MTSALKDGWPMLHSVLTLYPRKEELTIFWSHSEAGADVSKKYALVIFKNKRKSKRRLNATMRKEERIKT